MERYAARARAEEIAVDLAVFRAARPVWLAQDADAPVDDDDWSGVLGSCHARRPRPGDGSSAPPPADREDWGYGVHAV